MLAEDVIARIEATIPALNKRTRGALSFAELLARGELPNYSPAAFVIHNGMSFGTSEMSDNAFVQEASEVISIMLVIRTAGDVTGAKGQGELHTLVWGLINALAGWAPHLALEPGDPDDEDATIEVGVMTPTRGSVARFSAGGIYYQLDFSMAQQVRVIA